MVDIPQKAIASFDRGTLGDQSVDVREDLHTVLQFLLQRLCRRLLVSHTMVTRQNFLRPELLWIRLFRALNPLSGAAFAGSSFFVVVGGLDNGCLC